jgi:hypothetical protein
VRVKAVANGNIEDLPESVAQLLIRAGVYLAYPTKDMEPKSDESDEDEDESAEDEPEPGEGQSEPRPKRRYRRRDLTAEKP